MAFQSTVYGTGVHSILAADGDGHRPIPLLADDARKLPCPDTLVAAKVVTLLPAAPHPEAALAGLWMYFGRFHESHEIAQDIHSAEGSYWHAMLHRQEPDNWNAKYWLRRVGTHPIHGELTSGAAALPAVQKAGLQLPASWNPLWFADLFDAAANDRRHQFRDAVSAIQLLEWQLLFHHCALSA